MLQNSKHTLLCLDIIGTITLLCHGWITVRTYQSLCPDWVVLTMHMSGPIDQHSPVSYMTTRTFPVTIDIPFRLGECYLTINPVPPVGLD